MFGFLADIAETDMEMKAIQEAIKEAVANEVLVGIPDDENNRTVDGAAVTNAELLYIHTHGSPVNGIPARPVIEPAIEREREKVASLLEGVANAALSGNKEAVQAAQERAGMQGANIARKWFTDEANNWPELKPASAYSRIRKMPKAQRPALREETRGGDTSKHKPLIDTGELRKSITYKIRRA
jgi:hypothetical protein